MKAKPHTIQPSPPPLVATSSVAAPIRPLRFRPLHRPPMALLTALDDGCDEQGEAWRVRARHLIGSVQGDTVIAHDPGISAEHAEIRSVKSGARHRWRLTDCDSTNGTFVRIHRGTLRHGTELLLGAGRYRFLEPESPQPGGSAEEEIRKTRHYQSDHHGAVERLFPRLVELTRKSDPSTWLLKQPPAFVGGDSSKCQVAWEDPFLDAQHALIYRDGRQHWRIEDLGSLNGVWVRIQQAWLGEQAEFQLGEQRFKFRALGSELR